MYVRLIFFLAMMMFINNTMYAQYGYGTKTPSKAAVLELHSTNKGFLIPRVKLENIHSFLQESFIANDSSLSNSLLVYNIKTTQELSPGFYYWTTDGTNGRWNRLITEEDNLEPWRVIGTNEKASDNHQAIYQMGPVTVGRDVGYPNVFLDIAGAVRIGSINDTAAIGEKSFAGGVNTMAQGNNALAYGSRAIATGVNAIAIGNSVLATNSNSMAVGHQNIARGSAALASGYLTQANGNYSFSAGRESVALGHQAVSFGENTYAHSRAEFVIGRYNEKIKGNKKQWNVNNPLFQIGIGENDSLRKNALTVLKNGWVGVGFSSPTLNDEILRVNGAISATNSTYPDYVFESYFNGTSTDTPTYRILSLEEVLQFIQKNKHLPGIPPASTLLRTESGGYEFNLSQLTIQLLEKIEELYLYIIEQQDKILRQEMKMNHQKGILKQIHKRLSQIESNL